jgi:SET domain-containing protein
MYIECSDDNCPNGSKCTNRRFQRRGFGIQTISDIPKDAFILEYKGEIISTETSLLRMKTLYKFAKNHYFLNYGPNEVIDGYRKGTIARFANHSCNPNCRIEKWYVIS